MSRRISQRRFSPWRSKDQIMTSAILADPRQLLATQHVEHAHRSEEAADHDEPRLLEGHPADDAGVSADGVPAEDLHHAVGLVLGSEDDEATLVRHVHRVEAQDLAGAAHVLTDGNGPLVNRHANLRRTGNFVQGTGKPSAGDVPKAVDIDACLLYTSDAADDLLCVDLGGR